MEDLKNIPFNNRLKLASFDISNMYTNIPTQQLPDIITYLCKQNYVNHLTQTEILKLCNTILEQNYFEYQDTFYSQTQGLAMGTPTSSVLSKIFLQYIEHTQIYDIPRQHNIIGYFRYVDDILIVYNDKDTNIQNLLKLFNNISPTLNFTIEHEVNNSINFLDLTIYKNQQFSFRVYLKPTATDIIIPHDSNHHHPPHPKQKTAAIRYFANKIITYPLDNKDKDIECNAVKQILHNNVFNPNWTTLLKDNYHIPKKQQP